MKDLENRLKISDCSTKVKVMAVTFTLAFLIIAFAIIELGHGYSDGAPELSCNDMTPSKTQHRAEPMDIATLPYAVSVNFNKAGIFQVTIKSLGKEGIRGYLVMVMDNTGRPVGQFTNFTSGSKGICGGTADRALAATHSVASFKSEVTLIWTSPNSMAVGTDYFIRALQVIHLGWIKGMITPASGCPVSCTTYYVNFNLFSSSMTLVHEKRTFWANYEVPLRGVDIVSGRDSTLRTSERCGGINGYEAVPFSGCTEFRQYTFGRPVVAKCANGTLFDYKMCACNHASRVRCDTV